MALTRSTFTKIYNSEFISAYGRSFASESKKSAEKVATASPVKDVSGLSSKVLNVPNGEVGSSASKNGNYKNPEYFCYHPTSYFEAELEMLKFRLPQPSAGK